MTSVWDCSRLFVLLKTLIWFVIEKIKIQSTSEYWTSLIIGSWECVLKLSGLVLSHDLRPGLVREQLDGHFFHTALNHLISEL
jgi:hypothetical protein